MIINRNKDLRCYTPEVLPPPPFIFRADYFMGQATQCLPVKSATMSRAIVSVALCLGLTAPAVAQVAFPLLEEAPCGWFVKSAPFVWSSVRVVRLDTWGVVTGLLSFAPGTYRVDDGTDAYELIERKCGRGPVPDPVYRAAMPLPFGLLPGYQ